MLSLGNIVRNVFLSAKQRVLALLKRITLPLQQWAIKTERERKQFTSLLKSVSGFIALGVGTTYAVFVFIHNTSPFEMHGLGKFIAFTLKVVVAYFAALFVLSHVILLVMFKIGKTITKKHTQAMEYAYMLLASLGIFSIVTLTVDLAKSTPGDMSAVAQSALRKTNRAVKDGVEYCETRIPNEDGSFLMVKEACSWFSDVADFLDTPPIRETERWQKLETRMGDMERILKRWKQGRFFDDIDPLNIVIRERYGDHHLEEKRLDDLLYTVRDNIRQSFLYNQQPLRSADEDEEYGEYAIPTEIHMFRFLAIFLFAYAIVLRISKLSAETLNIVSG